MLVYVRTSPFVLLLKHCKTIFLFFFVSVDSLRDTEVCRASGILSRRSVGYVKLVMLTALQHLLSVCVCVGQQKVRLHLKKKTKKTTTHISKENGVVGIQEQCSNETSMGHLLFDSSCPANRSISG